MENLTMAAGNIEYTVHESSYVDDGVEIGAGTRIWHFCHLLTGTKIGRDCRIGQNVVIGPHVRVGNNVKIQNNVSIYQGVTLEDDVFCGPSMVFTNVITPRSAFPRNSDKDFAPTLVKRGASIGANATIVCGRTIGQHALIGAGAVVTKDVPAYAVFYGNPARQHGWACQCGRVLAFRGDQAECPDCRRRYRRIDARTIELASEANHHGSGPGAGECRDSSCIKVMPRSEARWPSFSR